MATTTIEAHCNARPTRLAFIVPKPEPNQLYAVFSRASTLWGGVFNPIVIVDDSTRKTSGVHCALGAAGPYLTSQVDLLKAFDPDLLINYSTDQLPAELDLWKHRTFPAAALDWAPMTNSESYFVDVVPLLQDLWDKEFKGFENPRVKIKFVEKSEARKSLLLSAQFGLYPNDDFYDFLRKNFKAEQLAHNAAFRPTRWPGGFLAPSVITSLHCQPTRQRIASHAFFLLNPDDPYDVIDYWNLRAAGKYVFPLTLEHYQECSAAIMDFGASSSYPINETVTNYPVLIKAASISDDEQKAVTEWIKSQGLVKNLTMKGWVSHFKEYYGVGDEVDIEPIRGFEANAVGVLVEGYGKLEGPAPSFLAAKSRFEHWSMDVSFSAFGSPTACYNMPWLNAGCDELASLRLGMGHGIDAARISRSGTVVRHLGYSGDLRISPVKTEDVVRSFLQGIEIEYLGTSSPGLALERIVEMTNGFHNCKIFQNSAIRAALEELANGDHRLASAVRNSVIRSLRDTKIHGRQATQPEKCSRADDLLDRAIEANVFRVGLVFQCARCRRHNWYAVTEFDKHYNCKSCFSREQTPRLDTTTWYYASDGLFRSTNKLDGNMTVLLALAFFGDLHHQDLKYAPSFEYKLDGEQHEIDFAILASEFMRPGVEMVFGESKSGMALKDVERKKLKEFGQRSGAYICFCTLSEDFDVADKEFFKELLGSEVKLILLPRFFLEMDHFEFSAFRLEQHPRRGRTESDWLMRTTIIRTLGEEFARKHDIWI